MTMCNQTWTDADTERERVRFESWMITNWQGPGCPIVRTDDGEYWDNLTRYRWDGWLARAKLDRMPKLVDLPGPTPQPRATPPRTDAPTPAETPLP